MHRALLIFLFLFCVKAHGQQLTQIHVPVNVTYMPNDFFVHVMFPIRNKCHLLYIGVGVNRTVFQHRLYPEIAYRYSKYIDISDKFHVVPYTRLGFDFLKVSDAGVHKWINPELGINFEFGNQRRFGIGAGYMMLNEFWKDNEERFYSRDFGWSANVYWIML